MLEYLFYLASGRLVIWLLQTNGLMRPVWNSRPVLTELSECDLCLGFWVYLILGAFLRRPFQIWPRPIETGVLAAIASFTMHLLRLGWQAKFGGVIIDD